MLTCFHGQPVVNVTGAINCDYDYCNICETHYGYSVTSDKNYDDGDTPETHYNYDYTVRYLSILGLEERGVTTTITITITDYYPSLVVGVLVIILTFASCPS